MADHLITGTRRIVVIKCGNLSCGETWEQGYTPLDDPGWNVCPACEHAAPTNAPRVLTEREARRRSSVALEGEKS